MNYLLLFLLTFVGQYYANAADVTYNRAVDTDTQALVDLINTEAYKAENQIVVLPGKYREASIQSGIEKQRLFVAQDKDQLVGFKKLFLVKEQQECNDILRDEIRCIDGLLLAQAEIDLENNFSPKQIDNETMQDVYNSPTTYIYNGADFTSPKYRGKGINSQLTKFALAAVTDDIIAHAQQHESKYIAMLFGLTDDNAVDPNNLIAGRSKGIVALFKTFAQQVTQKAGYEKPSKMLASRYLAYKPSFDPQSDECRPLPDEQSIKGCGCVLAFKLRKAETTC